MLLPRLPGNLPAMCSMAIGFFLVRVCDKWDKDSLFSGRSTDLGKTRYVYPMLGKSVPG